MVLRTIWQFLDRDVTHKLLYGSKPPKTSPIFSRNEDSDITHDNASLTVTSNFDVLARKFGYQRQRRLNAFYSAQRIFYQFVCQFN